MLLKTHLWPLRRPFQNKHSCGSYVCSPSGCPWSRVLRPSHPRRFVFTQTERKKQLPPFWGIPLYREGACLRWPCWGLSKILAGSSKGTPTPFQAFQTWFHVGEFFAAAFFVKKKKKVKLMFLWGNGLLLQNQTHPECMFFVCVRGSNLLYL